LGITHFLAKPFTVLSIQQIIRQFMETPGFAIRQDRLPFSQVHLEQFQQLETHRTRPTSIEQMEKNSVESVLKRQLH
jgi:response regulator of citrate/malate metabolism